MSISNLLLLLLYDNRLLGIREKLTLVGHCNQNVVAFPIYCQEQKTYKLSICHSRHLSAEQRVFGSDFWILLHLVSMEHDRLRE